MTNYLLGEFIREKREELGLTVRDIAAKAEISFSQWSKLERGLVKDPTEKTLEKVSYALNVDKDSIFALAGKLSPEVDRSEYIQKEINAIGQLYQQVAATVDASIKVSEESNFYIFNKPMIEKLFHIVDAEHETKELNDSEKWYIAREMDSAYKLSVRRLNARRSMGKDEE